MNWEEQHFIFVHVSVEFRAFCFSATSGWTCDITPRLPQRVARCVRYSTAGIVIILV